MNFILYIFAVNSDLVVSFLSSISTTAGMYIFFSLIHYNKEKGSSKTIFTTYLFFIFFFFSPSKDSGKKRLEFFLKTTAFVLKFFNKESSPF